MFLKWGVLKANFDRKSFEGKGRWRVVTESPNFDTAVSLLKSGMGAYAGAARRRVHLATVLPRLPSGHRPG